MTAQVVSIRRKKYAVGLFWQPTGTGVMPRNYARYLAHSVNKKLNLYTDFRGMVGLGARRFGHRGGMPSLAAEVVGALDEYSSFLAVFKTDRGFYLIAVRNGIILEDKVLDSDAAARAEYVRLAEIPDWAAFIAPAAWGMPRAVERNLNDIVRGRPVAYLRAISRFRTVGFSVFLGIVFLIGLGMIYGDSFRAVVAPRPQVSTLDPEKAAEYLRQIEEKNRELDERFEIEKPLPPEPIVLPYDNLPNPAERAALCFQAIGFVMQPIPGWNQMNASCGETHATANIRRTFGTIGDFYVFASELMPNAYVEERSEDLIQIRASLPALPLYASVDERDAETIVRDVMTLFQSIDGDVSTDIVVDVLTNGVETIEVNVVEVAASSKLSPVNFMQIFDSFGGVYMARAEWVASNRTWNYEVMIYAK